MVGFRERAADGLQVGDSFRTSRTFTDEDVTLFAQISKDYNPVHFDARFAKARNFPRVICHGLLAASLLTEIGGQIGWLASAMNIRFKGPVYAGETITCNWIITAIDQKGRAKASVTITKEDEVPVIEAEISGIIPGLEERKVLSQMLSEGDPTNGLGVIKEFKMTEEKDILYHPFTLGDLQLPNRVLMAPLTRSRSKQPGDIPWELNAIYYAQRAGAGLIFSEATQVSPQGKGYAFTPGIYSDDQVEGWRKVTTAVHEAGGRIYLQLWHVGRISRPELQPDGQQPVAPSAIKPEGAQTYIDDQSGMVEVLEPRALSTEEIPGLVEQFRQGAMNAKRAGFDGVEIHGANGYLLDQFIRSKSNQRTDEYGGSIDNRLRFPLMVVDAVVDIWGVDRTGIRVSPTGTFNDMHDDDPVATYVAFAKELNDRGIAFIEVVEDSFQGNAVNGRPESVIKAIRENFKGAYIANGNYSAEEAHQRIDTGLCELVSFGRLFISNPDLPKRFHEGVLLNDFDESTFYGGDEHGYTDYPPID